MIQLAAQFAERPDVRYGLTAMCVGLGQGGSVIWENPNYDKRQKTEADMTNYTTRSTSRPLLDALADGEVVTHSPVRDIRSPAGKVLALITLDNGRDHTRPNTLGPTTLNELGATLDALTARARARRDPARRHHGQAVHPRGGRRPERSRHPEQGGRAAHRTARPPRARQAVRARRAVVRLRERARARRRLEIALNPSYRTVDPSAAAIALPEVFLGIIPGWGGAYLLPNLIGIENALEVVISNPLKQNRMLKPQQAFDYGIVDAIFPAANYLEDSLRWADGVLGGAVKVDRKNEPGKIERLTKWPIAIKMARGMLESRIGTVPKSPYAALELLDKAKSGTKAEGFAREDDALADLVAGDQFAASMYAFDLVQKRAKRPVGAPDKELAKKVTKVGIIGAGLMASQFALLFVRKLQVPVLITDLDQARVDKGLATSTTRSASSRRRAASTATPPTGCARSSRGTTDKTEYADCDFVIEAVFEEVGVKQQVFGEIEQIIAEDAILATNTSSLSVEEIGEKLAHPERLVGFHFFNPVAVMPLIEIVKTPRHADAALSTAFVVAAEPRQERRPHRRRARLRREPPAREGHGRGGARDLRGHPVHGREGVRTRSDCR